MSVPVKHRCHAYTTTSLMRFPFILSHLMDLRYSQLRHAMSDVNAALLWSPNRAGLYILQHHRQSRYMTHDFGGVMF